MRTLAAIIFLLPTVAVAEAPITIHPFELTTRGAELDGKLVTTHCTMVATTVGSAVCLAPNGYGEINTGAEIDLSFATINNIVGGYTDEFEHAKQHCAGYGLKNECRAVVTGHVRDGRTFPALDLVGLSFRKY